jgi:hypothetical protein
MASIFRVILSANFMLVSCLAYSSNMKMQAIRSSETPANIHLTTWRYIPQDRSLNIQGLQQHICHTVEVAHW